jgi:preprotein translocase subunit YajC
LKPVDIGSLFLGQAKPEGAGGETHSSMGAPAKTSEGMASKEDGKDQKQQSACGGGGMMSFMLPLVLMFVVFYFFLIRPQQKKQKELTDMLGALRKGDQVITSGGIVGRITGLTDQYVVLEVQEKVRLKILRSHIAGKTPEPGPSDSENK